MRFFWKRWMPPALVVMIFAAAPNLASAQMMSCGQGPYCGTCKSFCCPHVKHCTEGGPRICFWPACGRPIANPCTAPNWGYYQTCWSPWPWGPDWSHCPVQPPATVVWPPGPPEPLPTGPQRYVPRTPPPANVLPLPRPVPLD